MKTLAILNQKGGVAKTTTSATLGHMLSTIHGYRVLLVDMDPQGNLSNIFSELNAVELLVHALNGEAYEPDNTVGELLLNKDADVHDCILKTEYKSLDIIPSFLTLAQVEGHLKDEVRTPQQFRLKNHLDKVRDEYDYCIIDCSPSLSLLTVNSLVAADEAYIPIKPEGFSALGMVFTKQIVEEIQAYSPKLHLGGYFFFDFSATETVSISVYQILKDLLPQYMIPLTLPRSKFAKELSVTQEPIYSGNGRSSSISKAYQKLADYILADDFGRSVIREELEKDLEGKIRKSLERWEKR